MNATSPGRLLVLLNRSAGTGANSNADRTRMIQEAMVAAGAEAELREVPPDKLARVTKEAVTQGVDRVVAVGGDGTLSTVATALAGTGVPMGILPGGTLNHFAKDLGIPLELAPAVQVLLHGRIVTVDVGMVNERVFINNSSIGLYPHVVRHRDQMRQRLGYGKWYAMLRAILAIFRRYPLLRLRMVTHGEAWLRTTPFVFVGNNVYHLDLFNLGQRSRLDAGHLCLYFSSHSGRTGLLRMALRALVGRLRQDRDFTELCTPEVFIDGGPRQIVVSLDGEVHHMAPPLHYRIWPGALRVIVPAIEV